MILRGANNPRKNSLNFSDLFLKILHGFHVKNFKKLENNFEQIQRNSRMACSDYRFETTVLALKCITEGSSNMIDSLPEFIHLLLMLIHSHWLNCLAKQIVNQTSTQPYLLYEVILNLSYFLQRFQRYR